jgi:hypothetical protein
VARWGYQPHFVSVVAARVPTVTDEHTYQGAGADDDGLDEISDQIGEAQEVLEDARRRLAEVPAEVVVTNHVMGLYELAAIHLGAQPPDLRQAALAIDAVGCLVEGLGERLGPDAPTMADALANIRLAFVQIKSTVAG